MTTHNAIADVIASNLNIAAPVFVFVAAWLLYGVLGKQFLGADDDFWPWIRGFVIPRLDRFVQGTPLWVTAEVDTSQYAGWFRRMDVDEAERDLEAMGYTRNPLASYQTFQSSDGTTWKEQGSWARRYGTGRELGSWVRYWAGHLRQRVGGRVPGYILSAIGRFLQSVGDITARRQVHVRIFDRDGVIHVFVHDELNSLNPVTALGHYRNWTYSADKGVRKFRADVEAAGMGTDFYPRGRPPVNTDPADAESDDPADA